MTGGAAFAAERETTHSEADLLSVAAGLDDPFVWLHGDSGIVAAGEIARVDVGTGESRFATAAAGLNEVFSTVSGKERALAFGSFSFDESSADSVLVVPSVVWRGDSGACSVARYGAGPWPSPDGVARAKSRERVRYGGSSISELEWLERVADAVRVIGTGALDKVVLARDVLVWSEEEFHVPSLLARLASRYPGCYTFACEGLIGATPELLVGRAGKRVRSLVLAGSSARSADPAEDARLGGVLLDSAKDLAEHRFAVESVSEVLGPVCARLDVEASPSLLRLANVQHLATRVTGELSEPLGALELAGLLHPTAAVCGTPSAKALNLIRELEGMDRGRYSGPVGWVDSDGDGEWGIALRCGRFEGARGRLFAGNGIVGESEPEDELEETRLKLRAMMSALEGS